MDAEQRARWQHVGSEERRAVMSFLMEGLGLSAVESASYLTASAEDQDAYAVQVLGKMRELVGYGNWERAYEEQKAHEAMPVAFHRTFLAVWGQHKQNFNNINLL